VALPAAAAAAAHATGLGEITVGIRPESFHLATEGGIKLKVEIVEELGSDIYVYGVVPGDPDVVEHRFAARLEGRLGARPGDVVQIAAKQSDVHAFDPATGERLG